MIPADPNPAYVETDRQAAEVAAIERMLDVSRGCFSLSVVVCNSPALRESVIGRLCDSVADVRVVSVVEGCVDVFGHVEPDMDGSALFVIDLERSIRSDRETQPTLRSLNASRELWERAFAGPIVFWLPSYVAALAARHAPDFWRYRSHRFELVSEQANALAAAESRFAGDFSVAANLSAKEKQIRIAELKSRIDDAGDRPSDAIARHLPVWLDELGLLYWQLGELDQAEQTHRKSLSINEQVGNTQGVAIARGNLGLIYLDRGDLDQAEQLLRESLELDEKLGRAEGIGRALANLGVIHWHRGDLERAEEMFGEAIKVDEKLGRAEGLSINYGNLAVIQMIRGNLDQAERMLHKAIEIAEKLGRLGGMAANHSNLATIHADRGDLDQAERMFRLALDIEKKLGRAEGMAIGFSNLAAIAQRRGDVTEARRLLRRSLELFQRMGANDRASKVQQALDDLPPESAN